VHFAAAVANFAWLETRVSPDDLYGAGSVDELFPLHPRLEGVSYPVSDGPGLGIEVDEARLTSESFRFWEAPHLKRHDGSVTNW
jgi:galactonate dehydratase